MRVILISINLIMLFFLFLVVTSTHGPRQNTKTSKILLLGFSEEPKLQPLIFGLFLSMYLITVFGNLLIILAVSSDPYLHTPMYIFLSNLSFVDNCFTSTTSGCCGTSRCRANLSSIQAASLRCTFSHSF